MRLRKQFFTRSCEKAEIEQGELIEVEHDD